MALNEENVRDELELAERRNDQVLAMYERTVKQLAVARLEIVRLNKLLHDAVELTKVRPDPRLSSLHNWFRELDRLENEIDDSAMIAREP